MERRAFLAVSLLAAVLVSGCTGDTVPCGGPEFQVEAGDVVTVDYAGYFSDGEMFDSGTFDFLSYGGHVVSGFDEEVLGMCVGEKKHFTVPPEKAYGSYQEELVLTLPLELEMNFTLNVSLDTFVEKMGEEPAVNGTYIQPDLSFPLKVISLTNDTVLMMRLAAEGDTVPADLKEPWELEVLSVNETTIRLLRKVSDGQVLDTFAGPKRAMVENGTVTIDMNHELAGQSLTYDVEVLEIRKKQEGDTTI
jgi:FKBP-type peptidyl-prolyl cis-trans isomerase 2